MNINAVKLKEVQVENAFQKEHPYIMDLTFRKFDFQKGGEQITGYSISEKTLHTIMGLSASSLNTITKPFPF